MQLAKFGYNITMVARNEAKMQEIAAEIKAFNPNI